MEKSSEHIFVAVRLALDLRVRLTGMSTLREVSIPKALHAPGTWSVGRMQRLEQLAPRTWRCFRAIAAQPGIHATFHKAGVDATELLGLIGWRHDLLVVEQTVLSPDEIGFDLPEHCVTAIGQPVLIVPFRGRVPTIGKRVLVAWNCLRKATIALQHPLPFTRNAKSVILLKARTRSPSRP